MLLLTLAYPPKQVRFFRNGCGLKNRIRVDCGRQFLEHCTHRQGYSDEVKQRECLKMSVNGSGFRRANESKTCVAPPSSFGSNQLGHGCPILTRYLYVYVVQPYVYVVQQHLDREDEVNQGFRRGKLFRNFPPFRKPPSTTRQSIANV